MRRIAAIVAVVVVGLAVASELVLPGIAEQRIRDRLRGAATGVHVHVGVFPALELLFGHSDSVTVSIDRYDSRPARLATLIGAARKTDKLDARVGELRASLVTLHDARLRSRGHEIRGEATLTDSDLRAATPPFLELRPIATGTDQLSFELAATMLGVRVAGRGVLRAVAGALVIQPDVPFGSLAALTVFSDPRIVFESVSAHRTGGGFRLSAQAHLR